MLRVELSKVGNSPFERLLGHNERILNKWNELEHAVFNSSLSKNLLEQVRRTLAFGNECEYCMVKAGKAKLKKEEIKEQIAISFAQIFVEDHKSISQEHFKILKKYFTDKEISELCSFISFISASQKLGRIYNLTENYQKNKLTTMDEIEKNKLASNN